MSRRLRGSSSFAARLTLLVLAAGCGRSVASPAAGGGPSPRAAAAAPGAPDSSLRAELLRLATEDQAGRAELATAAARNDTVFLRRFVTMDSLHTVRLKAIVARYGWPSPALVGDDGARAAWLLLQHSPDYAWQERMLAVVQAEAAANRIPPAELAMLTDRVLVHAGKPQRYGTSFSVKNGRLVADPIEQVERLDERRASVGLPAMAAYAKLLGELYALPVDWPPTP